MNLCRISGGGARWWSYRKWSRAREHAQPEVTSVTWPEVTEVCSVYSRLFPAFFLTIVVVQSVVQQYMYQDYRKWPKVNIRPSGAFSSQVTSSNVTSKGVPLGELCPCATKSCAISALLSPFHRKWRHQASRHSFGFPWKGNVLACATNICIISDQTSPVGLPLENMRACMHDRKYPWGAL